MAEETMVEVVIKKKRMSRFSYLAFFLVSHPLLASPLAQEFKARCPPFECGDLHRVGFPFSNKTHPECGLSLILDGCTEKRQRTQLGKDGPWFFVDIIAQDNTLTLGSTLESPETNCKSFKNLTLPISPFFSFEPFNQTMFKCPSNYTTQEFNPHCIDNDNHYSLVHPNNSVEPSPPNCSLLKFGSNKTQKGVEFHNLYTASFQLLVNVTEECRDCFQRGGQCQLDDKGRFLCAGLITGNAARNKKIALGLSLGITAIGMLTILAFCFRKKLPSGNSMIFWKTKTRNYQNIEVFLKNHGSLAPKRYSYSEIKKMTNSFKHKLGQGGFGGVYRGSLLNGRMVAVKILKEANSDGEEFINEVASISRTSHVNIVTLLGFCFEGNKRALIYELVPNGSLEKFIYGDPMKTTQKLKWETLYHIAVGIARGLEYLHRGCSTQILHFDIKPHNILLDEDFCPKISDFGLAKICPGRESIVSMTVARGTIGYIAPEVFCRNFGKVSHKSDVYSYGMMVLEMAGARNKKIDSGFCLPSEIYFPDWIYKHLEIDEDLGLQGIGNEEDKEYARKMIIVSLWCIQTKPLHRPTMSRVVDMLEGSLASLQIPPKPYLSSP